MRAIDELGWEGNSRAMFDRMLADTPAFMKDRALASFNGWVAANDVTTLTEELLERHVVETVPKPIQPMVLAKLRALKS
ncbi:MAG: hypothetical protein IT495_07465 [Gammaproteobacteria bacterium]|nr:hypothetical protein [Gammaproteobacteria bacterium]